MLVVFFIRVYIIDIDSRWDVTQSSIEFIYIVDDSILNGTRSLGHNGFDHKRLMDKNTASIIILIYNLVDCFKKKYNLVDVTKNSRY
jgi:hypothetical protein